MKILVEIESDREDIKWYINDILTTMKDHDEVKAYVIKEEKE